MRIIARGTRKQRTLYAEELTPDEFILSALEFARDNYRPVARYTTRQELELEAGRRGCEVIWQ